MRTEKEIKEEILKLINSKGNGTTYGGRLAKARKVNDLLWVLGIDKAFFMTLEKSILKIDELDAMERVKKVLT